MSKGEKKSIDWEAVRLGINWPSPRESKLHVMSFGKTWKLHKSFNGRASAVNADKGAIMVRALAMREKTGLKLVVHNKDASVDFVLPALEK